jgi:hypothetical protein
MKSAFMNEPRDEAWAAPIESAFVPLLREDLAEFLPGATEIALECRTTMCSVRWRFHEGHERSATKISHEVLGNIYGGWARGLASNTEHIIYFKDARDTSELIAKTRRRRDIVLRRLRERRAGASAQSGGEANQEGTR